MAIKAFSTMSLQRKKISERVRDEMEIRMSQEAKIAEAVPSLQKLPLQKSPQRAWVLWACYLSACVLPAIFVRPVLSRLFELILRDQTLSHIPFVPVVSAFFMYSEREQIFVGASRWSKIGAGITLAGAVALALARLNPWDWGSNSQISLLVLGFVLIWSGAFGVFFGQEAMRAAQFPLLFLWFAIPIPDALVTEFIILLQRGSADVVDVIFHLFHTPAARRGFEFALPGITIRVAEECSGIRSTVALIMTSVIAGHIWLGSFWRTGLLTLATIPISIAKNAVRIAVLSWLAVYVDPRFLTGPIHHEYGGMLFFGVGLALMVLVLALLRRTRPQVAIPERPT
jgi:exosortase